jgi:hypothetical protein
MCAIPVIAAALIASAGQCLGASVTNRPIVGAIRWDGWWADNPWEKKLPAEEYRRRLPFYGRETEDGKVEIRSDDQAVMDREISYAHEAGLDYWAFCWYHPRAWPNADRMNYGLRRYLASPRKSQLHFALILLGQHVGTAEQWPQTVEHLVSLFREPTYQQVLGGRPLVYTYEFADALPKTFGSEAAGREALELLRRKAVEAGAGEPYLVTQVWYAPTGAEHVRAYGFDAISAYAHFDYHAEPRLHPYRSLTDTVSKFWDSCSATGQQVIPIVMTGWDARWWNDEKQPWYAPPAPEELAAALRAAIAWNRAHAAQAKANAIIIYAWNETGEGGWLVPTVLEGTARLDALRGVMLGGTAPANACGRR